MFLLFVLSAMYDTRGGTCEFLFLLYFLLKPNLVRFRPYLHLLLVIRTTRLLHTTSNGSPRVHPARLRERGALNGEIVFQVECQRVCRPSYHIIVHHAHFDAVF